MISGISENSDLGIFAKISSGQFVDLEKVGISHRRSISNTRDFCGEQLSEIIVVFLVANYELPDRNYGETVRWVGEDTLTRHFPKMSSTPHDPQILPLPISQFEISRPPWATRNPWMLHSLGCYWLLLLRGSLELILP